MPPGAPGEGIHPSGGHLAGGGGSVSVRAMSARRSLFVIPLALGGLLACSGDDDGSSGTDASTTSAAGSDETTAGSAADEPAATAGGDDFCDRMEAIREIPDPDLTGSWESAQEQIAAAKDEVLAAYDEAAAAAPEDLQEDLQTVRDFSDEVFEAIANSDSLEDLGTAIAVQPQDVVDASSRIEAYVQETCGFGLVD